MGFQVFSGTLWFDMYAGMHEFIVKLNGKILESCINKDIGIQR
jgi:hypothetical protein